MENGADAQGNFSGEEGSVGGHRGGFYLGRPSPDPTVLTTQALYREVAALRELIEQRIEGVVQQLAERDKSVQKQFELIVNAREAAVEELRASLRLTVADSQSLHEAQIAKIDQQFELLERQRKEQKDDTKAAVDAALTAQKEAVKEQTTASSLATAKSETATLKQIEQLQTTFTTSNDALRRSIDEVKERIADETRNLRTSISEVERRANGGEKFQAGGVAGRAAIYAALAALATVVTIGSVILAVVR